MRDFQVAGQLAATNYHSDGLELVPYPGGGSWWREDCCSGFCFSVHRRVGEKLKWTAAKTQELIALIINLAASRVVIIIKNVLINNEEF